MIVQILSNILSAQEDGAILPSLFIRMPLKVKVHPKASARTRAKTKARTKAKTKGVGVNVSEVQALAEMPP